MYGVVFEYDKIQMWKNNIQMKDAHSWMINLMIYMLPYYNT